MDIVVKGRNIEVPAHYRVHVADKLHKIERYDHKLIRADVELFHERNPRQSDRCQRVEITLACPGPVIRAEAVSSDFYTALDMVISKLDTRLRRAADRRRVHRGRRTPVSAIADGLAETAFARPDSPIAVAIGEQATEDDHDQPWHIARTKEHPAAPMSVEDALFFMELVGHDFYLFLDKESGRPSVVYRRKGYDYGVLSLSTTNHAAEVGMPVADGAVAESLAATG